MCEHLFLLSGIRCDNKKRLFCLVFPSRLTCSERGVLLGPTSTRKFRFLGVVMRLEREKMNEATEMSS